MSGVVLDRELTYWPHQERAHGEAVRLWDEGVNPICCVAPCGAGKSVMMRRLARVALDRGMRVGYMVHRIQLLMQVIGQMKREGLDFGVRAASHEEAYGNPEAPIQVCSIQTEDSRMRERGLPDVDLVLTDEYHTFGNDRGKRVLIGDEEGFKGYTKMGTQVVGFTATPTGLSGVCEQLVDAGTYSEMRECGAHDVVKCYGPEEPDIRTMEALKRNKSGDYSERDMEQLFKVPVIFGSVLENWLRYNPEQRQTVLFAPSSPAARHFVDHFTSVGIPSCSITHSGIAICRRTPAGTLAVKEYDLTNQHRQEVVDLIRSGEVRIVANRYVIREAIDLPELYCAILATTYGSITSYLQSVGRIQRAYWGEALMLDHGGNYARHLSPNINRTWKLGDTALSIAKSIKAKKQKTQGPEAEPICCPKCSGMRMHGNSCPHCGHRHVMNVASVRQIDGTLKPMRGRRVKYVRPKTTEDFMRSALYAAWIRKMPCSQAIGYCKKLMRDKGLKFNPDEIKGFKIPSPSDAEWSWSVRSVFPWARPRGWRKQ